MIRARPLPKERNLFSVKHTGISNQKVSKKKRVVKKSLIKKKEKIKEEFKTNERSISFENISEGQIILGCIREIRKYEIIISLPHRMQGFLGIIYISNAYKKLLAKVSEGDDVPETIYNLSDLYSVGNLIIVKVKSISQDETGRVKVNLSILPEDVNSELKPSILAVGSVIQCAVTNTEDHGYVMDAGIKNLRSAFLSKEDAPDGVIGIGSVILCAVKRVYQNKENHEGTRIKLSSQPDFVSNSFLLSDHSNVTAIIPGTVVEAEVKMVFSEGLQLLAGESFKGFVSKDHLFNHLDVVKNYIIGQKVKARVLYVADFTSVFHCTLNSRICQSNIQEPLSGFQIGDIISNAKIYKSSKLGVHLMLSRDSFGFCSANKLIDSYINEEEIVAKFPVGSEKTCRVIHVNFMDQLFIVSLKKSILEEKVHGKQNLNIGQQLSVEILEHNDYGAIVSLSKSVHGFVPKLHITNSNMKNPGLKWPVGQKVTARIIRHTPGEDPHLTLKTDLVNSDLPIIKSFSAKNVGVITVGCIAKIFDYGLLVEFFGGTKAIIPLKNIPLKMRSNLTVSFQEGSIIKCKIDFVDESNCKMYGSLNFISEMNTRWLKLGDVVDCEVISVEENKVFVCIDDVPNKKACIPLSHLSDDVDYSKTLFKLVEKGTILKRAVVYAKEESLFVLSLKPSVLQSLASWANETEFAAGDIFPSVVSETLEDRIQIAVPKGKFGLKFSVSKANLVKGTFETVAETGIHVGQTLFVKCLKSDTPTFSSHLSKVTKDKLRSSMQLLYNTLITESHIRSALSKSSGISKFKEIKIGSEYSGEVVAFNKKMGALIHVRDLSLDGVLSVQRYNGRYFPKEKQIIRVRVLNVNYKEMCLELTAQESVKSFFSIKKHNLEPGQEGTCEILVTKREYIIGRLNDLCEGQIVYLPAKRHINDFKGLHSFYEVGANYNIVIQFVEDCIVLATLKGYADNIDAPSTIVTTNSPKIAIKKLSVASDPTVISKSTLTRHDFYSRAFQTIQRGLQYYHCKRRVFKNVSITDIVGKDSIPQFDDEFYWDWILKRRKEKAALKKRGLRAVTERKPKVEHPNDPPSPKRQCKDNIIVNPHCHTSESFAELKPSIAEKEARVPQRKQEEEEDWVPQGKQEEEKRKEKAALKKRGLKTVTELKRKVEHSNDPPSPKRQRKNKIVNPQCHTIESFAELKRSIVGKEARVPPGKQEEGEDRVPQGKQEEFLQISSSGFDWSGEAFRGNISNEYSSSDEDNDNSNREQKTVKRLSKFERDRKLKVEEKKTRELELERMETNREPETALDFEEKIEKNPNCSLVWIEYISFYLSNAETEKARGIASRALKVIPPTLEEERLALWNVALRLDVMYGTPESVQDSFKHAMTTNDKLKIIFIMLDIYDNANKISEAEDVIKLMTKKFSQDKEVWIRAFYFYFKAKKANEARNILDKSLLSLPKQDHIDVINRFAQFEVKMGEVERGKTIFEKILSNFPKRLDIWNVYADLLIKQNDIQGARNILERATGLKLRLKAMRTTFKRLLEFEKLHGTPQRVDAVKARVEEYVASALKGGGDS